MSNTIPSEQNSPRHLDQLAAYSWLYLVGKRIVTTQMVLTLPIPIGFTFLAITYLEFRGWAALYGVVVAILDAAFLENWQKSQKQQAAKIQELFDCELYQLEWNEVKVSNPPDRETIEDAAANYKRKNPKYKGLVDWYPQAIEPLSIEAARLVCQRTNCRWDGNLRRRIGGWVLVLLMCVCLVVTAAGFATGFSVEKLFIAILAPLLPAILWCIREIKKQRDSADTSDRLKNRVEAIWRKLLNNQIPKQQLDQEARYVQDEIYNNRSTSPLIFNWIYNLSRSKKEQQMNKAAEEYAEEALRALHTP